MLSERFVEAVGLAVKAHDGQVRKNTEIPYAAHVLGVASLVLDHGGDEDQAIAGLLHDVLEDCGAEYAPIIRQRFGDRVADIVLSCTDGDPGGERSTENWYARKEAYLATMEQKPIDAFLVSTCDKLHNARAIASDYGAIGKAVFERFRAGREGTVWYYRSLRDLVQQRLPDSPVARDLTDAVAAFEQDDPRI